MQVDAEALEHSLRGLRERAEESALADAFELCVHTAVRLFGVTGAGVTIIDDAFELRSVATTDAPGHAVEELQVKIGEGPCVEALRHDRLIAVEDLATDERWPDLRSQVADIGVRAVLGAPVHMVGAPVGSVNVYRDVPHVWSEESGSALQAYADVVEGVLTGALRSRQQSDLVQQLRASMEDRVTIERAIGLVMGRDRVDAVTAFNQLRRSARDARKPVVAVAGDLLRAAAAESSQ